MKLGYVLSLPVVARTTVRCKRQVVVGAQSSIQLTILTPILKPRNSSMRLLPRSSPIAKKMFRSHLPESIFETRYVRTKISPFSLSTKPPIAASSTTSKLFTTTRIYGTMPPRRSGLNPSSACKAQPDTPRMPLGQTFKALLEGLPRLTLKCITT